jgi:putative ABC transport system permease protein
MIFKLVFANLYTRRARTALTVAAIGLSVALVVAMTSGFAAIEVAAGSFIDRYMGAIDAEITRTNDPARGIDWSLVQQLRDDPRTKLVIPRLTSDAPLPHLAGGNPMFNRASLVGVERGVDPLLDWMKINAGRWFEPGERGAMIDQGLHEKSGLNVGDTLKMTGPHGTLELPITGIVHKPGIFGSMIQTVYIPLPDAQQFVYGPTDPNRVAMIRVQYAPDIDGDAFIADWTARLAAVDPLLRLKATRASRAEIDSNFRSLRLLGALGGAVAMLSATFIIFSTLSMGVTERQRTLAMLRAIGMSKSQVARFVLAEGVMIGVLGVLVGIPLGFGFASIVVYLLRSIFELTPTLDPLGVLIGGGGAILASAVAGLIPAWQATRVDPLEAMTPLARKSDDAFPWKVTLAGLLLLAMDPLILFFPFTHEFDREIRFYAHFAIGLPSMMIGFFLLAPAMVYTLSHTAGRLLAVLFRVPYAIVRQQISGGMWRSAGTCAALMVGLAVLIVMQTQGNSSLNSWKLPTNFPDVFIFTRTASGLSPDAQEKIRSSAFLKREDVMPIGAFAPEVGPGIMGLIGTRLPGATMFVAVDPDKAFRLMELDFREGSPEEATRQLKLGRHIVVTEEFKRMRKLGVGDKLPLKSRTLGTVEYTIAGVVWSPGIDVMVNSFDLSQQFEQQSAACVFGSLEDARDDFGVENVYLMCANFRKTGIDKQILIDQLRLELEDASVSVADVRQLKDMIQRGLRRLLGVASTVAWGALLVAGLGVTNTIVASIRSRSWQFGVLRSIGLTRGTLLRIVLCEGILLGVIGAAMGIMCGLLMTIDGRQLMNITVGHHPPLDVPWGIVLLGSSIVAGISLVSSIIPAIRLARAEPLWLLQAGRSAA